MWLKRLSGLLSLLNPNDSNEPDKLGTGNRFAPGCVYRGNQRNCPPFSVNSSSTQSQNQIIQTRPCYDINVTIDTLYQFIPVTTLTTQVSTSATTAITIVETTRTTGTLTSLTTFSLVRTILTLVTSDFFQSVTITFVTTISNQVTTTTFSEVVTGSVNAGTLISSTITTTVPILTLTESIFETTIFNTDLTTIIYSTTTTVYLTDAFAASITIGPNQRDWSYYKDECRNITYSGDGTYTGGPSLSTTNSGLRPLFINSNKHYNLYPCETFEISANYNLTVINPSNITSPLGYTGDPSYGAALFGAFDTDTGFSFYMITTESKAYAMYSRVPSWCPCVNATNVASQCGPCRGLDMIDDRPQPFCDPCGIIDNGDCNACGDCFGTRYQMFTATTSSAALTTSSASLITSLASLTTTSIVGKMPMLYSGPRMQKGGFQYYAFTYLIPIAYLTPGQQVHGKILLNKGAPSVTWIVNDESKLTITNIGQRIDPKFQIASYGGSSDYLDFPASVQLALGLLAVTESTEHRSPCQGGVYEECYQGRQSIQDARFTFCTYAPIQQPGTYNLTLSMFIEKLGAARIVKTPRPCSPVHC